MQTRERETETIETAYIIYCSTVDDYINFDIYEIMAERTTTRRKVTFGGDERNTQEVIIRALQEDRTPNEMLDVELQFYDFDELDDNNNVDNNESVFDPRFTFTPTTLMQNKILEQIMCIEKFTVLNFCNERNELLCSLIFFIEFLKSNTKTKHFTYDGNVYCFSMSLELADHFASALQSISNNNGCCIESFTLKHQFDNLEAFQPIWNSLLDAGTRDLCLDVAFPKKINDDNNNNNNNYLFSNLSINTTLQRLELTIGSGFMWTQLFDAIKFNKGLEKLCICLEVSNFLYFYGEGKMLLQEMLLANISLLTVTIKGFDIGNFNIDDTTRNIIKIQTKLNRMWKRYRMKCKERAAVIITHLRMAPSIAVVVVAVASERGPAQEEEVEKHKKIEEERKIVKKKEEMLICLQTFDKKSSIRNELIYHFLKENADMYNVRDC